MKLWIAVFAFALFVGGTCLGVVLDRKVIPAPHRRTSEPWMGRIGELSVSRFADELRLDARQNEELDGILEEARRDVEAYARATRAAQEKSKERVMNLLSEEQKKKLEELLADERNKRAEAEVEKYAKVYTHYAGLSENQVGPLRNALTEIRNKKRELFAQKKPGTDSAAIRASVKAFREELNRRLESVFSPQQYVRYLELQELER